MRPLTRVLQGLLGFVGVLLCLAAGTAPSGQAETRSRVLLKLDLPESLSVEKGRESALNRLIDRIMALDDLNLDGVSARSVVAGQEIGKLYVDVDGMECQEAMRLVEEKVLDRDPIEIGLVGSPPLLRSWDVERVVKTQGGGAILLLRDEAAQRFRELTSQHIGESVYVQLGAADKREIILIQAVIASGRIQVRPEDVPADFFRQPVLGYPARVAGCSGKG